MAVGYLPADISWAISPPALLYVHVLGSVGLWSFSSSAAHGDVSIWKKFLTVKRMLKLKISCFSSNVTVMSFRDHQYFYGQHRKATHTHIQTKIFKKSLSVKLLGLGWGEVNNQLFSLALGIWWPLCKCRPQGPGKSKLH